MKKLIKSSVTARANIDNSWDRFIYTRSGQKFSIYSKFIDHPDDFQCQISEIHPYDLAEYTWAKKDSPTNVSFFKAGKSVGSMQVPEWDEEMYEDAVEYVDDIIDRICVELLHRNSDVEPRIDHT